MSSTLGLPGEVDSFLNLWGETVTSIIPEKTATAKKTRLRLSGGGRTSSRRQKKIKIKKSTASLAACNTDEAKYKTKNVKKLNRSCQKTFLNTDNLQSLVFSNVNQPEIEPVMYYL